MRLAFPAGSRRSRSSEARRASAHAPLERPRTAAEPPGPRRRSPPQRPPCAGWDEEERVSLFEGEIFCDLHCLLIAADWEFDQGEVEIGSCFAGDLEGGDGAVRVAFANERHPLGMGQNLLQYLKLPGDKLDATIVNYITYISGVAYAGIMPLSTGPDAEPKTTGVREGFVTWATVFRAVLVMV